MNLGFIGLGKMGGNMVERLVKDGHSIIAFDYNESAKQRVAHIGGEVKESVEELVATLPSPKVVWMMVPSGKPVDQLIHDLTQWMSEGDIIIDGGNSNYKDTIRRAEHLTQLGIQYIDVGTSGGIWGLTEGYSLMIGGEKNAVESIVPILRSLAPTYETGWAHVGPSGSGHFVKMIHNGIEYGMMQAFAEGFAIMEAKKEFELDLPEIAEIWRHGSVVRSWLLDLTAEALKKNPNLEGLEPYVADSGEGRWTVFEAIDLDVAAPVITESLLRRIQSRESNSFADRMLAIQRNAFGGHDISVRDASHPSQV